MNYNDKINQLIADRKELESKTETVSTTTTTETTELSLTTGLKPSEFYPIRTARYWADVEAGKAADISFYKALEDGTYEVHKNATKGFNNVVDTAALHQVMRETAYELSLNGESDVAIFRQANKIVPLKIALMRKQYFPNGSLMMYHGLVNFDTGTAPWIMTKKFYYDKDMNVIMENIAYEKGKIGGADEATWNEIAIRKLNNKYGLDLAEKINLGKIEFPVITMTNTGADRWGAGTSDTAEVQDVLKRLDIIEEAIDRAIRTSKIRLFQTRKNGSMKLGDTSMSDEVKQIMEDVEVMDIVEDPHLEGGNLQISDRTLNVDQWFMIKKSLLQDYYSHTGENVASDAHGNNQHTYEVQSKGDNKYRRATSKKTQRRKELIQLIEMIISLAKSIGNQSFAGLDEISVNINEVDIRTEFETEDKAQKLLEMGLISKVQALMKIEGIDEMTAMRMLADKNKHEKVFKDEKEDTIVDNTNIDNNKQLEVKQVKEED